MASCFVQELALAYDGRHVVVARGYAAAGEVEGLAIMRAEGVVPPEDVSEVAGDLEEIMTAVERLFLSRGKMWEVHVVRSCDLYNMLDDPDR